MQEIKISVGKQFKKEFLKLQKKYRTLTHDFEFLKNVILDTPSGDGTKHWVVLKQDGEKYIVKIRMMCRAVKGSSFRVIYYYDGEKIELIFLETYFKGNKTTENRKRIEEFWKQQAV